MSKITVWFIKLAFIYLAIGVVLGAIIGIWHWNGSLVYSLLPTHVHLGLLGWMSMMIYGVGYHILPRFAGKALYSNKLASIQFWTANIGLIGMAIMWPVYRTTQNQFSQSILVISYIIEVISVFLFVYNMLRTIK